MNHMDALMLLPSEGLQAIIEWLETRSKWNDEIADSKWDGPGPSEMAQGAAYEADEIRLEVESVLESKQGQHDYKCQYDACAANPHTAYYRETHKKEA